MNRARILRFSIAATSLLILLGLSADGLAQGKGKGNGGGKGNGNSQGASKSKSNGKSNSAGTVTIGQNGTPTTGGQGKNKAHRNSNRFNGVSKKTGMSPEAVEEWYERERLANPRLNHGRFTAAQMVGRNHNIPPQSILDGMRNGDSLGQVLRRHRLTDQQVDDERKKIKKMADDDRNAFPDYVDDDKDWKVDKNKNKNNK